ncbi:MAG: metallophosphoesterase [Actinobacteria bacterium]|nr:metallophosphoesterase [Actinomycetota bacterium]
MKIIQTSDLHLSSKKPERIKALENIISKAVEEKADVVLVSGDLFDSDEQAGVLRPVLRNMLSSLPFVIIAIPGNHDMESYRSDLNFGNSIRIMTGNPFEVTEYKDTKLISVPYSNQNFNDLVFDLRNEIDESRINILMLHCTLDIPYLGEEEYGQEERQAYLPVSSRVLGDLGFDYIMSGHFHSRVVENHISGKTVFIYSGSPVSVTKKEQGIRRIALLDTGKAKNRRLSFLELDSFYHDRIDIDFYPGREDELLKELKDKLGSFIGRDVCIEVRLGGFISVSEKDIGKNISSVINDSGLERSRLEINEEYRDIESVLEDPLYRVFKEKLENMDNVERDFKDRIDEMVIMQFSRLKIPDGS